jgi:hypothetical protein
VQAWLRIGFVALALGATATAGAVAASRTATNLPLSQVTVHASMMSMLGLSWVVDWSFPFRQPYHAAASSLCSIYYELDLDQDWGWRAQLQEAGRALGIPAFAPES